MRSARLAGWVLGFAVVATGTGRAARADIPVPGTHNVTGEVSIDFGPFAGHATWRYEAKEGDTFASIAATALGDAKRADVIATLNPGVDAAKPKVGTKIVLPPKATDANGPRDVAWWDVLHMGHGGGGPVTMLAPLYEGEKPEYQSGGSWSFYAVPHDRLAALREKAKHDIARDESVARSESVGFPSLVKDGDSTAKIVTKYRLGLSGERKLTVEIVEQKRYDAKGVLLSQATGGEAPVPGGGVPPALLAGLGALVAAMAGIALWSRRRHAPDVAGGATA